MSTLQERELLQTEEWRPVVGYEGLYEVSNSGSVRSLGRKEKIRNRWAGVTDRIKKPRLMRCSPNCNGYLAVWLSDHGGKVSGKLVHRLVAEAFIGSIPERADVAHGDGVKTNAHVQNLRFATRKENCADKLIHGTHHRGERSPHAKITSNVVREIRRLSGIESQRKIGHRFGISQGQVARIVNRKCWGDVDAQS